MPLVNPRLLHDNYWRDGTILASSDEHASHPATDTQIDTLEMYWRLPAPGNGHPLMWASNDLGEAKAVNSLAILEHNLDSSAVITLYGADDAAYTVNVVTRPIAYHATSILAFFETMTKRYIKVQVANATNPADYLKISTVWAGSHLELNRRYGPEHEEGEEDHSESEYSDSQVFYAQERDTLNVRSYSFQGLDTTSATGIQALLEGCKTVQAFILCIDYNDSNANILWVRNAALNPLTYKNGVWSWEAELKEVK